MSDPVRVAVAAARAHGLLAEDHQSLTLIDPLRLSVTTNSHL
jgi:hypothetical protein